MEFVITLVDWAFTLYIWAIIARALISWLPLDQYNPIVVFLDRITDPLLAPLRRVVPLIGMMDITPIVALIILQVAQAIIYNVLVGMSAR